MAVIFCVSTMTPFMTQSTSNNWSHACAFRTFENCFSICETFSRSSFCLARHQTHFHVVITKVSVAIDRLKTIIQKIHTNAVYTIAHTCIERKVTFGSEKREMKKSRLKFRENKRSRQPTKSKTEKNTFATFIVAPSSSFERWNATAINWSFKSLCFRDNWIDFYWKLVTSFVDPLVFNWTFLLGFVVNFFGLKISFFLWIWVFFAFLSLKIQ